MGNKVTMTHVSGPHNSTPFTDCCGCAAIGRDANYCPSCGRKVIELEISRFLTIPTGMKAYGCGIEGLTYFRQA